MNETLRRALLRAGISDEDIAARLQIDPKTVRRWLDGRLPYPRHRWALAGMLGVDEADLWPALRAARTRPAEVRAVYPCLDALPRQVWLDLFGSAEREIDILAEEEPCFARDPEIMAVLADRVGAGVKARVCLAAPWPKAPPNAGGEHAVALAARWKFLLQGGKAQVRQSRTALYHSIYRADDHLLIGLHAQGVTSQPATVVHLAEAPDAIMTGIYLAAFDRVWGQTHPFR